MAYLYSRLCFPQRHAISSVFLYNLLLFTFYLVREIGGARQLRIEVAAARPMKTVSGA